MRLRKLVSDRLQGAAALAVDGVYLLVWLAVNAAVNLVREFWEPEGVDSILFGAFQVVFGIGTLAGVVKNFWQDLRHS
jgi:hypothetical protein